MRRGISVSSSTSRILQRWRPHLHSPCICHSVHTSDCGSSILSIPSQRALCVLYADKVQETLSHHPFEGQERLYAYQTRCYQLSSPTISEGNLLVNNVSPLHQPLKLLIYSEFSAVSSACDHDLMAKLFGLPYQSPKTAKGLDDILAAETLPKLVIEYVFLLHDSISE